jgi:hypothetical protein
MGRSHAEKNRQAPVSHPTLTPLIEAPRQEQYELQFSSEGVPPLANVNAITRHELSLTADNGQTSIHLAACRGGYRQIFSAVGQTLGGRQT